MQINGFNSSLNMALMVGMRTYQQSSKAAAQAMERLANGKRINRTSDDPSGAAAADNLAREALDLSSRLKDSERSKAILGTADGGMSVLGDLLASLNATVVSAANTGGTTKEEREGMQLQAESILLGITMVLENTSFDGKQILKEGFTVAVPDGSVSYAGISLRSLGARGWTRSEMFMARDSGPDVAAPEGTEDAGGAPGPRGNSASPPATPGSVSLEDLRGVLNLVSGDTQTAQEVVKGALDYVNGLRSEFGTKMKYDLGSRLNVTRAELEGVTSEYSRIVDADYAVEVSALVRAQILQQVSIASLQTIFQTQRESTLGLLKPR